MSSARSTERGEAPGKLVLSGSYSVLFGAPAIVTAVGRFARADRTRPPVHVAEEVAAAVRRGLVPAPCFVDASELRVALPEGGSRKLGLGSSAAILLATLVAYRGEPSSPAARDVLFEEALATHREAQGGGSGIDVAASTYGGTRRFSLGAKGPETQPIALPAVTVTVFAARESAVTSSFVAKVRAHLEREEKSARPLLERAMRGAHDAVASASASALVRALGEQRDALALLGRGAGVPIVTAEVEELATLAAARAAFFGPSGAGGGDVAFHLGEEGPDAAFVAEARRRGYDGIDCAIGAPGARAVDSIR